MTRVKLYSGAKAAEGADIALKNALFVPGWELSHELQRIRKYSDADTTEYDVAISFDNDTPVAVVIRNHCMLQAFCRASQRRKGHAAACVRAIRKANKDIAHLLRAVPGIQGSQHFWAYSLIEIRH